MADLELKMPDEEQVAAGPFQLSHRDYEATRRRKALCLKNALTIVERFGKNPLTLEQVSFALPWLEREQFDDIPVERAGYKNCGYLLCLNQITIQIKQTYRISNSTRKVYEVGERRYFCSDWCYRASCHLRKQIPREPVWCRPLPDGISFKPVHVLSAKAVGRPGYKKVLDGIRDLSLHDDDCDEQQSDSDRSEGLDSDDDEEKEEDEIGTSSSSSEEEAEQKEEKNVRLPVMESVSVPKHLKIVERKSKVKLQSEERKSAVAVAEEKKIDEAPQDLTEFALSRLRDWTTKEAVAVLHGTRKPVEEKFETQCPAVNELQSEYEAKVTAFYHANEKPSDAVDVAVVMPLVDSVSQKTYRLRLLMEALLPSVKAVLNRLKLPIVDLCDRVQQVAAEFRLSNKNLYLKPRESTLISLTLLHILTTADANFDRGIHGQLEEMTASVLAVPSATAFYTKVDEILSGLESEHLNSPS